jgi:tRNA A-37 threonylcarbamoyl transferase component Bud32
MNPNRIEDYCREHGYDIEKKIIRKKSLIYYLAKNKTKLLLKKLLTVEAEDIDQKYKSEIRSIERVNDFSTGPVRAPRIIDTVDDDHFYVCERIEGFTLYHLISSPFYSRAHVKETHRILFQWLGEFYNRYKRQKHVIRDDTVFSLGPYTKKISAIAKDRDDEARMGTLLLQSMLPVSVVHGDLTPWNIIIRGTDNLYIIDWGNGGEDFPAHDVTRYLLQLMRKMHWSGIKQDLYRLFIQSFAPLFQSDPHVFNTLLQYHYLYSRRILLKKTQKLVARWAMLRYLRLLFFYTAYHNTVFSMNRTAIKSMWNKQNA